VWTPDGQRLVFFREGRGLFWQSADGTGSPEPLTESGSSVHGATDFVVGPDRLLFDENTFAGWKVKMLDVDSRKAIDLVVQEKINSMNSAVSPDGRWLAYQAAEAAGGQAGGRRGIFVRPFPDVQAGLWQIACEGCTRPVWARDGRELFYLSGEVLASGVVSIWTVPIQSSPTFRAGTPRKLFEGRYFAALAGTTYDVTPDGQRFLMIKPSSNARMINPRIIVVDNWLEELRRRVPAE
jgi:serine/threonine-protein kinase